MKNIKDILLCAAVALGLGSCANEAPFSVDENGTGQLRISALNVELKTEAPVVRSGETPDVKDFTVQFLKDGTTPVSVNGKQTMTYGELPEVVMLPVGEYKIAVSYGANEPAAYDAPYYLGESDNFEIELNKLTDDISPVVCKLSNVKVSIIFDDSLVAAMSSDSKVEVKVGENGVLVFDNNTNKDKVGYFRYDEGSHTLAANFLGTVDGDAIDETKTREDIQPGYHYQITFKLHDPGTSDPGDVNPGDGGVKVDATVTVDDLTGDGNFNPDKGDQEGDEYLEDSDRPQQGEESKDPDNPDNPKDPDNPDNPDQPNKGPEITANDGIDLNGVNIAADGVECVLHVTSETGITEFTVNIDSNTLTPEELEGVGLPSTLDLVHPDASYLTPLHNFGFLKVGQDTLEGEKDVELAITPFLGLLNMLGPGHHNFHITVKDADGTKQVTLQLETLGGE